MVRSCCAIGCTVRDGKETKEAGIQFYRIPQDETKRMLWVNAIRRKDWQPSASTVICSQHFVGGKCLAMQDVNTRSTNTVKVGRGRWHKMECPHSV